MFVKRYVFAQEREVGNEVRSQKGLCVWFGANSMVEEEHNSQAASLKKRLESKLRLEWTRNVFVYRYSFPLPVIAFHFPWWITLHYFLSMPLREGEVNPTWISGIEMSLRSHQWEGHIHLATVIELRSVTWPKSEPPASLRQRSRSLIVTLGK